MDKVLRGTKMEICMRVTSNTDFLMEKVLLNGEMARFIKDNGEKGNDMDTGNGEDKIMKSMWVNGGIILQKDLECIYGKMEISMKESGSRARSMDKERTFSQMEIRM